MNQAKALGCAIMFGLLAGLSSYAQPATGPQAPSTGAGIAGPKVVFETPVFDFGKAPSGELIKYTFYFTNTGTSTLILSNVHPSCGCTTAGAWTREVPPGQTGSIPIQFSAANLSGPVAKTVTVTCNDKSQNTVHLQIKGNVWRPIDVTPAYAVLNLQPDSTGVSSTVGITNNTDHPVDMYDAKVNNPAFTVDLKTNVPGKAYQIVVSPVMPVKPGSISGQVTVRTTVTNMPVVTITTWANVQPPVTIVPPTINLPQAPLGNQVNPIITIINNTTNRMAISNAQVNIPGITVTTKELQPGKYFTLTLSFPKGFESQRGQTMELTAETTNPKHRAVRVPIFQAPKPAVAAQNYIPVPAPPTDSTTRAPAVQTVMPRVVTPRPSVPVTPPPMPSAPPSLNAQ